MPGDECAWILNISPWYLSERDLMKWLRATSVIVAVDA